MDTATQPTHHHKHSRILFIIFILVALVAIGLGLYLWQMNTTDQIPQAIPTTAPSPTNVSVNTQDPTKLNTYTNKQYNFTLSYPAIGVYPGGQIGACGKGIKEDSTLFPESKDPSVVVDNFFVIQVIPWDKSIADYIQSQKATGIYNTKPIQNSNADEALQLTSFRQIPSGNSDVPLGYVNELYKKDKKLFLITDVQNPGNPDGCLLPSGINPTRYPQVNHDWSVTNSLIFNN